MLLFISQESVSHSVKGKRSKSDNKKLTTGNVLHFLLGSCSQKKYNRIEFMEFLRFSGKRLILVMSNVVPNNSSSLILNLVPGTKTAVLPVNTNSQAKVWMIPLPFHYVLEVKFSGCPLQVIAEDCLLSGCNYDLKSLDSILISQYIIIVN